MTERDLERILHQTVQDVHLSDEARRRIRRMIAIRLALAALLVWVMFRFHLPIGVKILLAAVILGRVWKA